MKHPQKCSGTRSTLLPLENFQPAFTRAAIASAVMGSAMAISPMVHAQTANNTDEVTSLAPVQVQGQAPYQATEASSVRMTAPLLDTPRTVTVLPEQLIQDRGVSTLADVLRTTPGITLGAGEGGTPTGDRPFIRGYESSNDTTIDGVRDYARGYHETFNLETVEIVKGPSSAYGGRGGTGGSINLQTKRPKDHDAFSTTLGAGNDDQWSGTLDGNIVLHDSIALRLNVMKMGGKTPGRDHVEIDRFGFAPSLTIGMNKNTRATLSYSLVRNNDTPDQGFPLSSDYQNTHPEYKRPPKVRRENFYGRKNVDFRESWAKHSTLLLEHDFSDTLHLRNITRYSETLNHYFMGRPTFDHCAATLPATPNGIPGAPPSLPASARGNPIYGTSICNPHSADATYRSGTRLRWRGTTAFVNQTDLIGEFHTGSVKHSFDLGMEFGKDRIYSRSMSATGITDDNGGRWDSSSGAWIWIPGPRYDLHNPTNNLDYNYNITYGDKLPDGTIESRSVYFFDTMEITERFLVNAGLRFEKYKVFQYRATNTGENRSRTDNLLNYQLGLVYKPATNGSIYLSYATSSNPAAENLGQGGGADGDAGGNNLGNTGNVTGGGVGRRDQIKPEKSRSIELGTKWDVLDKRLSLTAAIFETKKTDARSRDPLTNLVTLDGNNRVRGLELGVSGSVTPLWDVWAGYTYLDPEMTKYRSGGTDYSGKRMKFIPKRSGSVWTTYKVLPDLTVGGGVTVMGMRYANDTNTYELPSYKRVDLMAKYEINKNFALQLNANNITNTELYDSSHVGLFYNVGPGRSYMLTASYRYE